MKLRAEITPLVQQRQVKTFGQKASVSSAIRFVLKNRSDSVNAIPQSVFAQISMQNTNTTPVYYIRIATR